MDNLSTGGISSSTQNFSAIPNGGATSSSSDLSFKDMVKSFLGQVNDLQQNADEKIKEFAAGNIESAHEVFLAIEKANLALNLAVQIRDRVVDAYNAILQMQV